MPTDFVAIALALSGPRGSGRTYRMIQTAPKGATVLAGDALQAQFLRRQVAAQGRSDLQVVPASFNTLLGRKGPFLADHHTVEGWMFEAGHEIKNLRQQVGSLEDENHRLRGLLKRRGINAEPSDCTSTESKGEAE